MNTITIDDYNAIVVDDETGKRVIRKFWRSRGNYQVGIGIEAKPIDGDREGDYEILGNVFVYECDDVDHIFETDYKEATKENLIAYMTELNDDAFLKSVAMYCSVIDGDYFDMLLMGDDGILRNDGFNLTKEDDTSEKSFMFWQSPRMGNEFRYVEFRNEKELKAFVRKFDPEHEKLTAREWVNHYYENKAERDGEQYWCEISFVWRDGRKWFLDDREHPIESESDLYVA